MSLFDLFIGKPIATTEDRAEHIGPISVIPVFGLDALSYAAYEPEAALTLLIPLSIAGGARELVRPLFVAPIRSSLT